MGVSRTRRLALGLLVASGLGAPAALAQSVVAPTVVPAPASPSTSSVPGHPAGQPGLSPSRALINQGDAAFLARDVDSARALYQQAIRRDPQVALAHLRMAQLHISQGEFEDAAAVLLTAARFSDRDPSLRAATACLQAQVTEVLGDTDQAVGAWNAFRNVSGGALGGSAVASSPRGPASAPIPAPAAPASEVEAGASSSAPVPPAAAEELVRESGPAPGYPGTVQERTRVLLARKTTLEQSALVKARIEKRFQEAQVEAGAPK